MKKLLVFILIFLISASIISALCEENQIDINSASKEELDNLYGIGPVKAEAIINSRPFNSVDELIEVYGIGEITLTKIKEQGLACVNGETEEINEEIEENNEIAEEVEEEQTKVVEKVEENEIKNNEIRELEIITLTTKDIKSEDNEKKVEKSTYATYGFIGFCVLLGVLFMLRRNKYKNEFR